MLKLIALKELNLTIIFIYSGGQNPFNVLNFGKEVFMEIVIKYEK